MMRIRLLIILVSCLVIFLLTPSCNQLENLTGSSAKLICHLVTGSDLFGSEDSTTAFSDVILASGTVVNDTANATLTAVLLDPVQATGTFYQDIIVDQVDIQYTRANGQNIEGLDVPYTFSQRVNARVSIGATITLNFVLITHNAKLEPPLVELINLGQEHILKLEAHITIHGKDIAGNRVEPATAVISVWCSNFADED